MNSKEGILKYLFGLSEIGIKLGLENVTRLLEAFDKPHLKIPSVHIAGTNGKGSVAAMTESVCRRAGVKTGLFTSPHLIDFSERIKVNGKPIPFQNLEDIFQRVHKTSEDLKITPTFFEFSTVIAFIHFYEQGVELNILEVGLGGRLDATNVCQPLVSIITSIAKDHTQYLGEELHQIAFEKASIIKDRGTVLANIEEESVFNIVRQLAKERSATLLRLGSDFKIRILNTNTYEQSLEYEETHFKLTELGLPLLGKYQAENAGLAVKTCRLLARTFPSITAKALKEGLKSTYWPGRMEVWSRKPLIIFDCAHNPSGVKSMTSELEKTFPTQGQRRVIFGVMKDKAAQEMLEILSKWANQIILVRPKGERSEDPEQLKIFLGKPKHLEVSVIPEIEKAIEAVKSQTHDDDLVCITGSLHTVSEAKIYFEQKHKNFSNPSDPCVDASVDSRS
jgi:dihydrofolate synthase / folylpolyglutamate synthase